MLKQIGNTLIRRDHRASCHWESCDTPLVHLNDLMVATFLNQNIAPEHLLIEAKHRIEVRERDGSEYFDGQLLEAIENVKSRGLDLSGGCSRNNSVSSSRAPKRFYVSTVE